MSSPIPAYPPTRRERRAERTNTRSEPRTWKPRHTIIVVLIAFLALMGLIGSLNQHHEPTTHTPKPTQPATTPTQEYETLHYVTPKLHVVTPAPTATTPAPVHKPAANEDNPGWDCRTQGNKICGPHVRLPDGSYTGPNGYHCTPDYGRYIPSKQMTEGGVCAAHLKWLKAHS